MEPKAILLPVCAQVLLTFFVWTYTLVKRITAIRRSKINPQVLADEPTALKVFKSAIHPADNFENLFELPVLFFVAAIILVGTGLTDGPYVIGAWTFVALRALHSAIHCTYNGVTHRFYAYLLGSLVLWAIWARLTFQLAIG